MDSALFEQLLHEEEGATVDFKRDQYLFSGASDDDKSELLKDILGFVNAWRRSDAYILIGVEDVRGGRGIVHGVSTHLPDHSLQQFVNSKTNRPIRFRYEAFTCQGLQVGIIHVEVQGRPAYLNKSYGKLKARQVYVRRGSQTDPNSPALADEIEQMVSASNESGTDLVVEWSSPKDQSPLGCMIELDNHFYWLNDAQKLPDFSPPQRALPHLPDSLANAVRPTVPNKSYWRELALYLAFTGLLRPVRLLIRNVSSVAASNIHVELSVRDTGVIIDHSDNLPIMPKRFHPNPMHRVGPDPATLAGRAAAAFRRSDNQVAISKSHDVHQLAYDIGNLQPGRVVCTDSFFVGVMDTQDLEFSGRVFADNLRAPKDVSLQIRFRAGGDFISKETLMAEEFQRSVGAIS